MKKSRHLEIVCLVMVGLLVLQPGHACMVCVADPMEGVLVSELQRSQEIVLARPVAGGGANQYGITKVLKGDWVDPGDQVEAGLPLFSEDGGKMGGGMVLLTRFDDYSGWVIRAPAQGLHQVLFFRKVLELLSTEDSGDESASSRRAAFFAGYLHHPDPMMARAAAAELSKVPYSEMVNLKGRLDSEKVRAELDGKAADYQRPFYYTLLGVCGDAGDAASINQMIDSMWTTNGYRMLPALLTAKLEFEGEPAVEEIEARYFRDRNRTLPEIEAAVLALRVHGNADGEISRKRVIEAYRTFFIDREPLIFYIVDDLARWEDWDSKESLVAIAEQRGDDLHEIRRKVDKYLEACPN
tara:strand:- start:2042 stop:3103 length:1062 start_codon:yes stop_codon:yes gene_type:complete